MKSIKFIHIIMLFGLIYTLWLGVTIADTKITHYPNSNVQYILNGSEKFSAGTISITDCDGANQDVCTTITILDRNLGAIAAGAGCGDPYFWYRCAGGDSVYGYHFQRGNNYGFNPSSTPKITTTQVESGSLKYDPLHQQYYSSSQFYKNDINLSYSNWLNDNSVVDLWGGTMNSTTDLFDLNGGKILPYTSIAGGYSTPSYFWSEYPNSNDWKIDPETVSRRQGPCPKNFHVPSMGERIKILDMLGYVYGEYEQRELVDVIRNKLLIPFADFRYSYNAFVGGGFGGWGFLWSSSPASNPTPSSRSSERNPNSRYSRSLTFDAQGHVGVGDALVRADALSIRCAYDFYQNYTETSNIFVGSGSEDGIVGTLDEETNSENDLIVQGQENDELTLAYQWAFKNGITTKKSIDQANMNGNLNRIAMAKMISQYAINVLKKTPDTTKKCNFGDVTSQMDSDYSNGVTLACQLGIMGVGIINFRPNDDVTRAVFGTALSRMLYGLADGTDKYYSTHLAKLKTEGIISNDNPTLKELRGYVMLMLMRSAK